MKHLLIFPALFLALLIGVAACSNNDKKSANVQEEKVFSKTMVQAEQGDARAQHNLGIMYVRGLGIAKNDKKALKWFRLAEKQGSAAAQASLGLMYLHGEGVFQNDKKALKWFRLAAKQGNVSAQTSLGFMHGKGRGGVPRDGKEALKWYTLAAEQGDAIAQSALGWMYTNGFDSSRASKESVEWFALATKREYPDPNLDSSGIARLFSSGIPLDLVRAYMWMSLSADLTTDDEKLSKIKEAIDSLVKTMTPQETEKAQRLSRECKAKNYQNC